YLFTDYTNAYDYFGSTKGNYVDGAGNVFNDLSRIVAPVARGWSRAFDGSALNPQLLRTGVTQSDIYQEFNRGIWISAATARILYALQRTYSYIENDGAYSYDNPAADVEGVTTQSYNETRYDDSYLQDDPSTTENEAGRVN